jgi:hypothetical protein
MEAAVHDVVRHLVELSKNGFMTQSVLFLHNGTKKLIWFENIFQSYQL